MDKKGSVLIISLWILAILVVFAVGLGHRALINLRLARYQKDRLKAHWLAKAGVNKAIAVLEEDASNPETKDYDSLNDAWSTGVDVHNNHIFENMELKEKSEETFNVKVTDEESKININSASRELLVALFKKANIEELDAQEIANYILIWRGEVESTEDKFKDFKKAPLSCLEELIIILEYFYQNKNPENFQEEAQSAYNKIKDLITVYTADIKMDVNTVSVDILGILADSAVTDDNQKSCSRKVAEQIIALRDSKPDKAFKDMGDITGVTVDTCDETFLNKLKDLLTVESNWFKIESAGKVGQVSKKITAIYNRDNAGAIVSWHEN